VAVATALTGKLTDPRELHMEYPSIPIPEKFHIDDSMVIQPAGERVEVFRGPNISDPPHLTPMPEDLRAGVAIKVGDKITTDHIIPAGPVSRHRSNIPKSSDYIFYKVDPHFAERCRDYEKKGLASIIVAGLSYGQGSSREHAALCPAYLGVRAVIAKSIERIHMANLVNFGILPLMFKNAQDYDRIQLGDELFIGGTHEALNQSVVRVKNLSRDFDFDVSHVLTPRQIKIIQCGGLLNSIREKESARDSSSIKRNRKTG
jgi:aconitate hydratase